MINDIVKQMLEQHEGGEVFFDNLDEEIKMNDTLLTEFLDEYVFRLIEEGVDIDYVIASGGFGRALQNYGLGESLWTEFDINFITVNGSLRKGEQVDDFGVFLSDPKGNYLFIDDSFYSGKTRDVIKDKIESYGGSLVHTAVLYDGCYETHDDVSSMYRYYDNH